MTKKYSITPEHRVELENIKQKYIQNARRTDPMTEYDKAQMRLAMRGIYKNAGLPYVGDDKIIFVKSPLIAQCASGMAMAMIHNTAEAAARPARAALRAAAGSVEAMASAAPEATDAAAAEAAEAVEGAMAALIRAAAVDAAAVEATDAAAARAAEAAEAVEGARAAAVEAVEGAAGAAAGSAVDAAARTAVEAVEGARAAAAAAVEAAAAAVEAAAAAAVEAVEGAMAALRAPAVDAAARTAVEAAEAVDAAAAEAARAAAGAAGAAGSARAARTAVEAVDAAAVEAADAAAGAAAEAADAAARTAVDAAAVEAADAAAGAAGSAARAATDAAARSEEADAAARATARAAEEAKHPEENSLDLYIKAMISCATRYGRFCLFSVSYSWQYLTKSAMWPWYQVYGDFFKNVAKLEGDWDKWDPINLDALHGGVRYTTKDFTIIADRPETLKIDEQGRLHNEAGPAVKWRDGMEQYYWHGLSIPDWWIKNKKRLTPKIALSQENAELRRCACEILGWANILSHPSLNPKVIDEDAPHIGTIYQVDLPEAPAQWFIKYQCGTGRWFAEAVNDKRYNTALKANAAKRGWRPEFESPPEHFIPFMRT